MDNSNRSSFMMSPLKSSPNGAVAIDFLERPYLPECWSDDKRMDVLFNPFRIREINPEGWDLKMTFWINLINKWCLYERRAVFTIDDLRRNFIRDSRMPHLDCIKLVMTHMKRQNKLLFKDEIVVKKNSSSINKLISAPSTVANWVLNSFMRPINFGWNLLSKDSDEHSPSIEDKIMPIFHDYPLVNRETLEILSESVEACIKTLDVSCMSYAKFLNLLNKNVFSEKNIEKTTLEVVLCYLETKNKIKVYEESGFKMIKFGADIQVKEADITLIKLEFTKEILEKEAAKLEDKIVNLSRDARLAIENDNKDKALFILKKKKRFENRLHDKDKQIDNIEIICSQLLETGSQKLILKAFEMANEILKQNTVKIEDAENIMTKMDDTLNDVSSLNNELIRPIGDLAEIELEAEKELEEMLEQMERDKSKSSMVAEITEPNNSENNDHLLKQLDNLTVLDDKNDPSTEICQAKQSNDFKKPKIALID